MKTYNVMADDATNGWTWLGTVEASCERQAMAEALDMVARSKQTVPSVLSVEIDEVDPEGIPLEELDAVDHDAMERSGLGLIPMMSPEIGPEFSEPGPAVPGKEV